MRILIILGLFSILFPLSVFADEPKGLLMQKFYTQYCSDLSHDECLQSIQEDIDNEDEASLLQKIAILCNFDVGQTCVFLAEVSVYPSETYRALPQELQKIGDEQRSKWFEQLQNDHQAEEDALYDRLGDLEKKCTVEADFVACFNYGIDFPRFTEKSVSLLLKGEKELFSSCGKGDVRSCEDYDTTLTKFTKRANSERVGQSIRYLHHFLTCDRKGDCNAIDADLEAQMASYRSDAFSKFPNADVNYALKTTKKFCDLGFSRACSMNSKYK